MPISIQGIQIRNLSLAREDGKVKVSGNYELLSNTGKVLATQPFGTESAYGSNLVVALTGPTSAAVETLLSNVATELSLYLGIQ